MAHGHTPDELAEMRVSDVEAIAVYHMTHKAIQPLGGD